MAGRSSIRTGKTVPMAVPSPKGRPDMVLGSRPPGMYAPRIKPLDASTRQYGKPKQQPAGSDPAGTAFSTYGES
jgi:hypothetical protein